MEAITTALGTAFTTMSDNFTDIVVLALPVALGIVGLFFGVRKGISFFRSVTGK